MSDKKKVGRPKGPDTVRLELRVKPSTKEAILAWAFGQEVSAGQIVDHMVDTERDNNQDDEARRMLDLPSWICGGCGHSIRAMLHIEDRTITCPDCGEIGHIGTH